MWAYTSASSVRTDLSRLEKAVISATFENKASAEVAGSTGQWTAFECEVCNYLLFAGRSCRASGDAAASVDAVDLAVVTNNFWSPEECIAKPISTVGNFSKAGDFLVQSDTSFDQRPGLFIRSLA